MEKFEEFINSETPVLVDYFAAGVVRVK